jgi:hypothetical protein
MSYFGYCLEHIPTGQKYRIDLRPLVEKFVKSAAQQFKASVTYHGERLYLLPFGKYTYLFVQTKTNEIVKAIEGKTLSVEDIRKRLIGNEAIGFASYIYMDQAFVGLASRVYSPRITAFSELMNKVVSGYGGKDYAFIPTILAETLPASAIKKLDHVGAVTVEMSLANSYAQDIVKTLTNKAGHNFTDIASVEVVIRPLRKGRRSLKSDLESIAKSVPSKGLLSLEARGREALGGQITDLYIVGEGGIRDFIDFDREGDLATLIPQHVASNFTLHKKVKEYTKNAAQKKGASLSDLGINRVAPAAPSALAQATTAPAVADKRRKNRKRTSK